MTSAIEIQNQEVPAEEDSTEREADQTLGNLYGVDVIESLCMSCGESGITRLMVHKVPFFRELILASFKCEYCGEQNNEVTFGGEIQELGCIYELDINSADDLNRQLIKSDSASLKIPEISFEIPPGTQKGEISTIEGFIGTAAKNLSLYQGERMKQDPEVGSKVAEIILALTKMSAGEYIPFHIIVDDPAGNSFIENPNAPKPDPRLKKYFYKRSSFQDKALGLKPEAASYNDSNFMSLITDGFGTAKVDGDSSAGNITTEGENSIPEQLGRKEVLRIPDVCPSCMQPGESMTAVTSIPHFKEVKYSLHFCMRIVRTLYF